MYCDACGHDYLLAFSCKTRYFCPSCDQKRVLLNGEWVKENAACARAAVRSKIAVDPSRGGLMIETQHSAEPDSALNGAVRPNCGLFGSDEPITQALMVPLSVVMHHELSDRAPQRRLADEHHAIKALVLDRAYEPLGVSVQVW